MDVVPDLQSYVGGDFGPFLAWDDVNAPMIRQWCEVMGDENPVYTDPAKAKDSVHGALVAPPSMLQVWDMRGYPMPDPSLIQNAQRELHAIFDEAGFTGVVATNTEQELLR